jgi:hypothetical protein
MKRIVIILIFGVLVSGLHAQGLGNILSQKKADIKYMLDQIAALQVYIGYAEKGYGIAQKGLRFIGDMKKGEFNLHNTFFNSLKSVNPSIRKYGKVADIISYQLSIINGFKQLLGLKNMSPAEMNYLNTVYNNLAAESSKSLQVLLDVITDNSLEMADNERIQRIDIIYADMKDKYAFMQSFGSEVALLSAQRENELNETGLLKKLN